MAGQVSNKSIIRAVLVGFEEAHSSYADISGGGWLWTAPEYFITAIVAPKIYILDGSKYVSNIFGDD